MKPEVNLNVPWGLCGYSNADYAGYKYNNNNMTGYAVLFNGLVITWHSQSQNISTLFVIEAEYSEIMEICCKILSIRNILLFMGFLFNTQLPCMLMTLEIYSHRRTHRHPNFQIA